MAGWWRLRLRIADMTLTINDPEAIAEIEELMARFGLSADVVVERVILEAGAWMPMEMLTYPRRSPSDYLCMLRQYPSV